MRRYRGAGQMDLPAHHVGDRRHAAFVGHVHDLDACERLQQLHAQMRAGAGAAGPEHDKARFAFASAINSVLFLACSAPLARITNGVPPTMPIEVYSLAK